MEFTPKQPACQSDPMPFVLSHAAPLVQDLSHHLIENHIQIHVVGSNATALANWGVAICRLWGMPVGMTLAGIGQTYLFRKSGSVWLGAFTMGIVCCLAASLYGQFRIM